jgi:hypothetical protein
MDIDKRKQDKDEIDEILIVTSNYTNYETMVNDINESFEILMKDYAKYYDLIQSYPSNVEYKQFFKRTEEELQNKFDSLVKFSNNIYDKTNTILDNINKIDDLLVKEGKLKNKINKFMNNTLTNVRSSLTLKSDYSKINFQEIYILVSLIISIILVIIIGFIINRYYTNTSTIQYK